MMDINKHNTHILHKFEYHAPVTIAEAVKLLKELGSEATILAGGTDLIVKMKDGSKRPRHVVNIKKIPDLSGVKETTEGLWIGALTKISELENSRIIKEKLPVLYEAVRVIGSVQVRNLATVGGNICNASPAADSAIAFLALDAVAQITGPNSDRKVPFGEFFTGPGRTVLKEGELLTGITVPRNVYGWKGHWTRVTRASMDIATISLAATAKINGEVVKEIRLAWGTVAPTPMRTENVEDYLRGKKLEQSVIEEAASLAASSIKPRDSGRSTGPYKRKVAEGFIREALTKFRET
jgi:CO/xanthine dehydrogenase FAD-binding subunit